MLHERTTSNGNFLNIKHGSLCLEKKINDSTTAQDIAQWEADGYVAIDVDDISRQNPDGSHPTVTKYIRKYAALDGKITKIEWYDRTDGGVHYLGAKLHIRDRGEHYQVDLPFGKRHFDYFTKIMDNIDFAEPIEINTWRDKKDQRQTAFVIKQNGDYVQWKYTRDDMGECPPAVQNRSGKWSFEAQREWLLARLQDVIIPHVESLNAFDEPQPAYDENEVEAEQIADDIGFGRVGDEPEFGPLHVADPPVDMPTDLDEVPEDVETKEVHAQSEVGANYEANDLSSFPKPAQGGFKTPAFKAKQAQIKAFATVCAANGVTANDIIVQEFTDVKNTDELSAVAASYLLSAYGGE